MKQGIATLRRQKKFNKIKEAKKLELKREAKRQHVIKNKEEKRFRKERSELNAITQAQYLKDRKEYIDALRIEDLNNGQCKYCGTNENLDHYMIKDNKVLTDEWQNRNFIPVKHIELRCDDCHFLEVWVEKEDDLYYDYPKGDNAFIDNGDFLPVKISDYAFIGDVYNKGVRNKKLSRVLRKSGLTTIGGTYKKPSKKGLLIPQTPDDSQRFLREARDKNTRGTILVCSKNC